MGKCDKYDKQIDGLYGKSHAYQIKVWPEI